VWVALPRSEARRVLSWWVQWARIVEVMGMVRESGGIWWNKVRAWRWVRTRHLSVGGEVLRDMMDSVGQWVYVVEIVRTCDLAMWPL
jgi:hypothetical protein